jgi:cyanate permease
VVGWRTTCLVWSLIMLACLPLVFFFVKSKRPEYYGLMPDGARTADPVGNTETTMVEQGKKYASDVQEVDFTLKQAVRTRSYWVIAISFALFSFVSGGFIIHSVPLLTDIGLSDTAASSMLSLMIFFTLPSRFFAGVIADRIAKGKLRFVLAVIFGMMLVGLGSFLVSPTSSRVLFLLIPYGLSSGAVTPVVILLIGRYYGRQRFGSIFGSCMLFNAIPQLVSPVYAGWIYDMTGSYVSALTVFAVLVAVATVVICFAATPRYSSH